VDYALIYTTEMTHQSSPAEQAAALVTNPNLYDSLVDEYDTELEFYSTLRNDAQKSLETFEEYVRLRSVFLNRGPTEAIRSRIEDRLDRSLKNMVLNKSPRGRAYAVDTLTELEGRRQTFMRLNVEVPRLMQSFRQQLNIYMMTFPRQRTFVNPVSHYWRQHQQINEAQSNISHGFD
jgi:hypothetical protein